jgi:hypothetical protein
METINESKNQMSIFETITNYLITKPAAGVTVAGSSTGISILTILGWIPPAAGIISALGALVILYYHIQHRRHVKRMDRLEEAKFKAELEKYKI